MGCTLSGSSHPATQIALEVTKEFAGTPSATVMGIGRQLDALNSAYINCLSSAAHAFDETPLATVIHPTGPIAAPLFALAERTPPMSGKDFLVALAVGMEVECQVGVSMLLPPEKGEVGWYATGIFGALGAAAAAARALSLSHEQTCWASGIAGNQASGYRQTHGSMCTSFVPGHAARCGMQAALLAQRGFSSSMSAIEGNNGFAQLFSNTAHLDSITNNLGKTWEIRSNAFKPYPCGIVIHPAIDAAIALHNNSAVSADKIDRVEIEVNPLCLTLCDRPNPLSDQDGQVSLQHWAAVTLLRGTAGLAEVTPDSIMNSEIVAMRARVHVRADATIGTDGTRFTLTLHDGTILTETITHALGSLEKPMSDDALADKFLRQAREVIGELLARCQGIAELDDVAQLAPMTLA